jgi:hypothetical protein
MIQPIINPCVRDAIIARLLKMAVGKVGGEKCFNTGFQTDGVKKLA